MPERANAIKEAGGALGARRAFADLRRRTRIFAICGTLSLGMAVAAIVLATALVPLLYAVGAAFVGVLIGTLVGIASTHQKKKAFLSSLGVGEAAELELVLERYERANEAKAALLGELDERRYSVNEAEKARTCAVQALFSRMEAAGLPRPDSYAEAKRVLAERYASANPLRTSVLCRRSPDI
jgi:hypothetical protein